jgi:hypothetical protein
MNSVSALLLNPFDRCSTEEKLAIKNLGRPTPEISIIQNIKSGKRSFNRKFNKATYSKLSWLCGCDEKNTLFCFPCMLFGGEDVWTKSGFSDINHLADRAKKHEASATHIKNALKLALFGNVNVVERLDSAYRQNIAAHNEKVKQNRYILNIIVNCIKFCGFFELALRGHDESHGSNNPGIFRGLIDFGAELDAALKNHLEAATVFKGTSKTIQNEMLHIMLDVCHDQISKEIKDSEFVSVIADETSDISNTFQMALIYRYVIGDKPVERFWGFLTPPHHDSDSLATCILNELKFQKINENPSKLIAQTYDGAAVMSGSLKGVQALIKESYPDAQYIHCHAHQLNLVMMKAASINSNVKVFFANIQGLCTFFSTSPQRTKVLDEIVKKRLPRSAPTRWNFQSRSIMTIYCHRTDLVMCMKTIIDRKDIQNVATLTQASGHLKILVSANFVFWLKFFSQIMPFVEILFAQLQTENLDIVVTRKILTTFEKNVAKVREVLDSTVEENAGVSSGKKRKIDKQEWKREAKEVCDVIISQAKERFAFTGHLTAAALFSAENFQHFNIAFPEKELKTVCSAYPVLNLNKLKYELSTIYSAEEFRNMAGAVSLYSFFANNNLKETFSECFRLLNILITIPMTTAEAERCFSTLKRIKTFLRNTMAQERLSALAMLSIEKDLVMSIPDFNQKVIEKFSQQKERRMEFLFK